MSDAKPTRGPWTTRGCTIFAGPIAIAAISNGKDAPSQLERAANRTLLAASPDLLDALREAEGQLICDHQFMVDKGLLADDESDYQGGYDLLMGRIRAAIAKATGATP